MLANIDKSLMSGIINSNEFKNWLISRRWFGNKSALSNLDFKVSFNYFEIIADRIFLTVIEIQTKDYVKFYFLPLIIYKKIQDILEPSEGETKNVNQLTENTFNKKITMDVEGQQKVFSLNLLEAEYSLFFWKKLLFDKSIIEKYSSYSLDLSLYKDQFQNETDNTMVQNIIEASLYPDRYKISIKQLGKGNTTNTLFLLSLTNNDKPEHEFSYVLKSYKDYSESIEPSKLLILGQNNFLNAPKLYGTIKVRDKVTISISENVQNIGNLGEIYWNELNNMVSDVFKHINNDYSILEDKKEVSKVIKQYCVETLKVSEQIGGYIKLLHENLIKPDDQLYSTDIAVSTEYLNNYTAKLDLMINNLRDIMNQQSDNTFYNQSKINEIMIGLKESIDKFQRDFKAKTINLQAIHQDLHMEQILYNKIDETYTFYFLDFEGDPQLTPDEKKGKFPIEKDLASFLRSLSYIKFNTLLKLIEEKNPHTEEFEVPEKILYNLFFKNVARDFHKGIYVVLNVLNQWEFKLKDLILKGLKSNNILINYFTIERALRELSYEFLFRPHKVIVPILGLKEIIDGV